MHSRKAIPYIILLFFPTHLIAQIGHSVEYQRKLLGDTTTSVGKWPNKIFLSRLVFDDTASFFYNLSQEIRRDPFKERKIYGLKLDNHSWYYKPGKNVLAEGHHLKTAGKHFLVLDTALRFNWVLLSDTKIIEGYTCFASLSVNNKMIVHSLITPGTFRYPLAPHGMLVCRALFWRFMTRSGVGM